MTSSRVPTLFPAVDTISIGGDVAPGQWILLPTSLVFGWQQQKGYALSGATVAPTGDELVLAQFLIRLWDETDYPKFVAFAAKYLRKAVVSVNGDGSNYALGITHPELTRIGVTNVVVHKTPVLTNNGKGMWTGTVEFLQYRQAVAAKGKPNAAIQGSSTPVPTAHSRLQAIQLQRSKQIQDARNDQEPPTNRRGG